MDETRMMPCVSRRTAVLLVGALLIAGQQTAFFADRSNLTARHALWASTGLNHGFHARFVYFLYYLGVFPLVPARSPSELAYSREGAAAELERSGFGLSTDAQRRSRYGEMGKVFLYLPDAWMRGSPKRPSVVGSSALGFTAALLFLYFMFWREGLAGLGILTALLMGSNPFQTYEVYRANDLFGWPVTVALAVLALHLPFLRRNDPGRAARWLIPCAAGILLATARQVRTEPVTIAFSVLALYALKPGVPLIGRAGRIALFAAAFMATAHFWHARFDAGLAEAEAVVRRHGGTVERAPRTRYHVLWHPVWCGLSDFDKRYAWRDGHARRFARPILKSRYGVDVKGDDIVLSPHYGRILRDHVLGRISVDPLWYGSILGRRVLRIFERATPVRLAAGRRHLALPWHAAIAVPLVAALFAARRSREAAMVLFLIPTSFVALFVYSDRGTTGYGIWHVMAAAVALHAALEAAGKRLFIRTRPVYNERRVV